MLITLRYYLWLSRNQMCHNYLTNTCAAVRHCAIIFYYQERECKTGGGGPEYKVIHQKREGGGQCLNYSMEIRGLRAILC